MARTTDDGYLLCLLPRFSTLKSFRNPFCMHRANIFNVPNPQYF